MTRFIVGVLIPSLLSAPISPVDLLNVQHEAYAKQILSSQDIEKAKMGSFTFFYVPKTPEMGSNVRASALVFGKKEFYGDVIVIGPRTGTHLCHLLRPELLKTNLVPLSSDAWTNFSGKSQQAIEDAKDVSEATLRMQTTVIPATIQEFFRGNKPLYSSRDLVNELHKAGISFIKPIYLFDLFPDIRNQFEALIHVL